MVRKVSNSLTENFNGTDTDFLPSPLLLSFSVGGELKEEEHAIIYLG